MSVLMLRRNLSIVGSVLWRLFKRLGIPFLSLAVGAILASMFWIHLHFEKVFMDRGWAAKGYVDVLSALRTGKTDRAISILEHKLDRNLRRSAWRSPMRMPWNDLYRNPEELPPPTLQHWQEAKAYYAKSPNEHLSKQTRAYLERLPPRQRKGTADEFKELYTGAQAPQIIASEWVAGRSTSLDQLRGKVVLLDFWGAWCPPCVGGLPSVEKLYGDLKDRGFEVIGIHTPYGRDGILPFLAKYEYSFYMCVDAGEGVGVTADNYAVSSHPTYYLIDKTGKLVWGPNNHKPDRALVETLLTQSMDENSG